MTGLYPDTDRIIRDRRRRHRWRNLGNRPSRGPVFAVHQSDATARTRMDGLEQGHAMGKSGLIGPRQGRRPVDEAQAEGAGDRVPEGLRAVRNTSPMCGKQHLPGPALSRQLTCRSWKAFFPLTAISDVSTLKELAKALEAPRSSAGLQEGAGRTPRLADIHESIDEAGVLPAAPARALN